MSPMTVKKLTIDPAALKALAPERRSAILLLGHYLNEANWLRKLLIQAVHGIGDGPEGQAQFGLTVMLATTLASKIRVGWDGVTGATIGPIIRDLEVPAELTEFRKELQRRMSSGILDKIRNRVAFHYPDTLDFTKLAGIDQDDTVIYVTGDGHIGDVFSQVAALAAIDGLIIHNANDDWRVALREIWEEVLDVGGRYCVYLSAIMPNMLMMWLPAPTVEDIEVADAPSLDQIPLVFFASPPDVAGLKE